MPLVNEPGKGPLFGAASFTVLGSKSTECYPHSLSDTIEEALVADSCGIDFFGVSEGYARTVIGMDSLDVIKAIGERTKNLCLCTSIGEIKTEELASRHEQLHAVIDHTHNRVEIILDRDRFVVGSSNEIDETDPEFNANLAEWCRLIEHCGIQITWIEVSGRSDAVLQAVRYRIPIMLQVNSGNPLEQKTFSDLYRMANTRFGVPDNPLGLLTPGFVAATDEEAQSIAYEAWAKNLGVNLREREKYDHFLHEITEGSLCVGSPDTVARKIARMVEHLGLDRFYLRYTCGIHSHEDSAECLRLYGTEVIPRVRKILGFE